jgi:L-ribulose-5-phosphate 3-epimerase
MQLDRRKFVGMGGAALVAASLPLAARAPSARSVRRLRKSCKIGMVQVEGSLEDKFKLLVELGYDGIELDSPNDLDDEVVLAAKEASGIEIPGVVDSVHWRHTLGDPDPEVRAHGRAGLLTALRDAKTYGSTTVLLVPAVVNANISYDQAYSRSQEEIRRVLPLADELGVSIAFENVWNSFLLSPLEAARYVDEFESERIGWYMDVGNIVNYGWPEQWIRILGHRVMKLDVKEFSRQKRDDEGLWKGFGVKLGEGDCNWPAVMQALDDIGYDGWASAEVPGGDRERLLEIREGMDRIFAG